MRWVYIVSALVNIAIYVAHIVYVFDTVENKILFFCFNVAGSYFVFYNFIVTFKLVRGAKNIKYYLQSIVSILSISYYSTIMLIIYEIRFDNWIEWTFLVSSIVSCLMNLILILYSYTKVNKHLSGDYAYELLPIPSAPA